MDLNKRQKLLMIATASVVGFFALDKVVLTPYVTAWKERSARIAGLEESMKKGRQLIERTKTLDTQWQQMQKQSLPLAPSAAENEVLQAALRWSRDSHINFNSLLPQWRDHDGGYRTLEVRANATAPVASVTRLLYALDTDPMAVRLEECEIDAHDDHGAQVDLRLRFSGLQLTQTETKSHETGRGKAASARSSASKK